MADEAKIDIEAIEAAVAAPEAPAAETNAPKAKAKRKARPASRKIDQTAAATMRAAPSDTQKDTTMNTKTEKTIYDDMFARSADFADLGKGNVEALVEAGKVFTTGMQDMGRTYVEDMQGAVATMQDDAKKMSSVTSPTELFQLQGELARRNVDAAVAQTSRNIEQMMKLANDMFAPLSTRASMAMDKVRAA